MNFFISLSWSYYLVSIVSQSPLARDSFAILVMAELFSKLMWSQDSNCSSLKKKKKKKEKKPGKASQVKHTWPYTQNPCLLAFVLPSFLLVLILSLSVLLFFLFYWKKRRQQSYLSVSLFPHGPSLSAEASVQEKWIGFCRPTNSHF